SDGETNFGTSNRWRRPTPDRRGLPNTPSPRGQTWPDRDPSASPDRRSSAACSRQPQSGPAAMHASTIRSNTRRRTSPSRKRSLRAREKRRMIRDSVLDTELAEPAIGEVHLHFTADQPFRADRKVISHDQHPDHQFRINRRAPHRRIVRCKFAAKPGQIESSIDLPHQMIFRNRVAKSKLVEQLTLVTLQTAHHGSTSPRFASTKRNHASRLVSTDF